MTVTRHELSASRRHALFAAVDRLIDGDFAASKQVLAAPPA